MLRHLVVRLVSVTAAGIVVAASPAFANVIVTSFDGGSAVELPRANREIKPASPEVAERLLGAARNAADVGAATAGTVILVRSTGEEGVTPTDTDNDFTRIVDALAAAAALGDGTTIELLGTFDWTEPNANADWVAGGYGPVAPTGLADITITAQSLGDAVILGPGDSSTLDVYWEGFLAFFGGTYQGWTISNLDIRGFDWSLAFLHDPDTGSTEDFNGLSVVNNRIEMPHDLNTSVTPNTHPYSEAFQNIGLHFAFGENQLIMGNEFILPGDSLSNTGTGELAASVAMQSNTSGGDAYDGLMIVDNTVHILNAPVIDPPNGIGAPFVVGIWENSGANASEILVSGNEFLNDDPANDPVANLQRAFRLHAQASAASGKTVRYDGNRVDGAHWGLTWIKFSGGISYDDTSVPVELVGNVVLDTHTAVRVRSDDGDARGFLRFNRVADAVVGLEVFMGEANAENNWWGCNEGLNGGSGCPTSVLNVGILDADPWLVAELLLDPTMLEPGASTDVTVDMRKNSDGVDVSGMGTLPDGTPVTLSTTADGTFLDGTPATVGGVAEDVLTLAATANLGAFEMSATIDNEVLTSGFDVTCPINLTVANTTISGVETIRAAGVITLGSALVVDGTDVDVIAGDEVTIKGGTSIDGSFSAAIDPAACTP